MTRQGSIQEAAPDKDEAASVAEALHKDFVGLIAIFDRQLSDGSVIEADERAKISDARAAAERGLQLSQELLGMLRAAK